jgi:hypothetical protein
LVQAQVGPPQGKTLKKRRLQASNLLVAYAFFVRYIKVGAGGRFS